MKTLILKLISNIISNLISEGKAMYYTCSIYRENRKIRNDVKCVVYKKFDTYRKACDYAINNRRKGNKDYKFSVIITRIDTDANGKNIYHQMYANEINTFRNMIGTDIRYYCR